MGTSSARRRSFGRGVRKFRIISQALQLQVRISLARRRSFRRVGEFTHFFVDGNDKQNGKYGSDGGIGREEVLPFQGTVLEPRHHVHILWHFRSLGKGMHEFLEWCQSELYKNATAWSQELVIGAYSMRPIHVKFLIEILLFIAASSLWLRRLEAWLFAWRMRWMSEQGFFGAQKNVYGTDGH